MFVEEGCPHCDCQYFDEDIDILSGAPIIVCENCGFVINVCAYEEGE